MTEVWEWIKKWAWAIVLGLISLLALGKKPNWVRDKEREIKQRDKDIDQSKSDADQLQNDYEEAKSNHDEAIKEAGQGEGKSAFTDPDSAAEYIDDILGQRKGE